MRHFIKAVPLLGLLAASGCAIVDDFADRAITYNVQAADTANTILLLNVVRASKRHPLQFTDLTSVTGTGTIEESAGVTIPFGPRAGATPFSTNPSQRSSGSAQFVTSTLDTQEFFQGILSPINMKLVDYYYHHFPRSLLLHLLISKIEIVNDDRPNQRPLSVRNTPGRADRIEQFRRIIEKLVEDDRLMTESVKQVSDTGLPPISIAQLQSLQSLEEFAKSGLRFDEVAPSLYKLRKVSTVYRFCFRPPAGAPTEPPQAQYCGQYERAVKAEEAAKAKKAGEQAAAEARRQGMANPSADQLRARIEQSLLDVLEGLTVARAPSVGDTASQTRMPGIPATPGVSTTLSAAGLEAKEGDRITYSFTLRSVEAIIYFLGEAVRAQQMQQAGTPPVARVDTGCDPEKEEPIFVVRKSATAPRDAYLSVQYGDETHFIPKDGFTHCSDAADSVGRTSQVMTLLRQLIALNKSAKDLPATSIISLTSRPN